MKRSIELKVPLSQDILPVITQFAEQVVITYGLSENDIKRSVLACEDVYTYLTSHSNGISDLTLNIKECGYYIQITFKFSPITIPLQVLNITATSDPRDPGCLAHMEIFIAAHVVDRFILDQDTPDETVVHLIIEKQYPLASESNLDALPASLPNLSCTTGTHEEIKQAAIRIIQRYGSRAPVFCRYPGKILDMIRSGEMQAAVYSDGKGNVAGCIFWVEGEHLIEVHGPYVFIAGHQPGEELTSFLLESVGRSGLKSLIIRDPLPGVPESWFEKLPTIAWNYPKKDQRKLSDTSMPLYRQLEEDTGVTVVVHPDFTQVVNEWYEKMNLPRFLTSSHPAGETPDEFTVFSVRIDNNRKIASLTLRIVGTDAALILAAHISHLTKQEISEITYEMDLSNEMEVFLVPVLIKSGFFPSYIIPWGGTSDILVFYYIGENL
ncbi:hypothetical protein [Methanospirillum lacunae]|uniref:Uncharacterized protein n=1 Tax=Methanospirillum lacunae TaxID=668570 RepID=A0A2V2NAL6_9EURY|nr:hypothetical protein [Methanospirillum lacunae]PWR72323.1 hypothetical protein DK846_10150 [Methanospirillum lacunae]